jgi:hypothetical protein
MVHMASRSSPCHERRGLTIPHNRAGAKCPGALPRSKAIPGRGKVAVRVESAGREGKVANVDWHKFLASASKKRNDSAFQRNHTRLRWGSFHQGKDLCPPALQCPRQGSLLGPSQSVMLTVTPTPFLGGRHALRHDASHRLCSGIIA